MNKLAQEFNPMALVLGFLGAVLGIYMANKMGAGILMKIMVFVCVFIACYVVATLIANKD